MALSLFAHPFSSYSQKVQIALYENAIPFEYRMLEPDQPANNADFEALWPLKKMPLLVDDGRPVWESSAIIEYLQARHPGPVRLIPDDALAAVEVRMMDRVFDNYVMTPMQTMVANQLRPEADRDPYGVAQAKTALEAAYGWLDGVMAGRTWAAGDAFSLADCAAAPSLFYADWAHEIGAGLTHLKAYRARLLTRPSVARCVDEARYFRPYFPLGAPDRD